MGLLVWSSMELLVWTSMELLVWYGGISTSTEYLHKICYLSWVDQDWHISILEYLYEIFNV